MPTENGWSSSARISNGVANTGRAYVNFHSPEGKEALLRALESPRVQRIADGRLSTDDIADMPENEVHAAFQLIRFAHSNGHPICPKCGGEQSYEYAARPIWKCLTCRHQYTLTSGTVLTSRKLPLRNYLFGLGMVLDRQNWTSMLQMSREMQVNYRTAWDLTYKFRAMADSDIGTTLPYGLISRATWNAIRSSRAEKGRALWQVSYSSYPFMPNQSKADGADLVLFVNDIVSRDLPDDLRADICQDMIVSILSGEATREQIRSDVKKYITKCFQQSPWKYKWISFDAPRGEDGGTSLHDIISTEDAAERYDRWGVT